MYWVVDASVAVKWYIPEVLSNQAVEWLQTAHEQKQVLLAPDLIQIEMMNVLWKKHRRSELNTQQSRDISFAVRTKFPVKIVDSTPLILAALEIALALGVTVYDALYLALTVVYDCQLITADEWLISHLMQTRFEKSAILLK